MDDMREIVTLEQANAAFLLLAVLGPLLGLAVGALIGRVRGGLRRGASAGVIIGLLATVNFGLWRLYLVISDRLGMDTVRNLLVNLALFLALGCAGGWIYSALRRRAWSRSGSNPAQTECNDQAGRKL